jgi:hypothetical protein
MYALRFITQHGWQYPRTITRIIGAETLEELAIATAHLVSIEDRYDLLYKGTRIAADWAAADLLHDTLKGHKRKERRKVKQPAWALV